MKYWNWFRYGVFCGMLVAFLAAGWGLEERAKCIKAQAQQRSLLKENKNLQEKVRFLEQRLREASSKSLASNIKR